MMSVRLPLARPIQPFLTLQWRPSRASPRREPEATQRPLDNDIPEHWCMSRTAVLFRPAADYTAVARTRAEDRRRSTGHACTPEAGQDHRLVQEKRYFDRRSFFDSTTPLDGLTSQMAWISMCNLEILVVMSVGSSMLGSTCSICSVR